MWPRTVEVLLGCWLLITPFVFRETSEVDRYVINSVACGALVIVASLLSFRDGTRFARFVTLLVSLWLAVHGYVFAARPGPPAAQNELAIGLMLLLFAILPNEINDAPRPWRDTSSPGAQPRRR